MKAILPSKEKIAACCLLMLIIATLLFLWSPHRDDLWAKVIFINETQKRIETIVIKFPLIPAKDSVSLELESKSLDYKILAIEECPRNFLQCSTPNCRSLSGPIEIAPNANQTRLVIQNYRYAQETCLTAKLTPQSADIQKPLLSSALIIKKISRDASIEIPLIDFDDFSHDQTSSHLSTQAIFLTLFILFWLSFVIIFISIKNITTGQSLRISLMISISAIAAESIAELVDTRGHWVTFEYPTIHTIILLLAIAIIIIIYEYFLLKTLKGKK